MRKAVLARAVGAGEHPRRTVRPKTASYPASPRRRDTFGCSVAFLERGAKARKPAHCHDRRTSGRWWRRIVSTSLQILANTTPRRFWPKRRGYLASQPERGTDKAGGHEPACLTCSVRPTRVIRVDRGVYRRSIGTYSRRSGPTYSARGRISRLFASCSKTCAVHPDTRLTAKMGVKSSMGMPIM